MASKAKLIVSADLRPPGAEAQERDRLLQSAREEEIRRRAYEIYLERGAQSGHELEDWLQAERELTTNQPNLPGE
jgi:Protein of unknown function (DUF2934)